MKIWNPSTIYTKAELVKEQADAIANLKELLPHGAEVYTILRHVSASGMSRSVSLLVNRPDALREISFYAAHAMDDKLDLKNGGIKIGGAGMDMGFALVYNLSRVLFPNGFACAGDDNGESYRRCPSNDHSNGDRNYTGLENPYTGDLTPHMHHDGGYALTQSWL